LGEGRKMKKNYCDKCGAELEPEEGEGIMLTKSFKIYFLHRNILNLEKEAYYEHDLCKNCYNTLYEKIAKFMKEEEK
jgi:RNase P subunit RPR2